MRTFPSQFAPACIFSQTARVLAALLLTVLCGGVAMAGSVVTVNSNNALVINGREKFAIGFSPGPPNNSVTPDGKDALQELREAGGLLLRIVQTNSWNSQLITTQQAAMDWAQQHGMYVWLNLAELSEFPATDTTTAASLRNIVDTFRDHPALGLWKNYDEAYWSGISVSNLQDGYNVIKQEDTNHPVVQTHAPRGAVSDLQPYNVAADILALDIYPVIYGGLVTNPPITNGQISQVGDWTDVLGQVAGGQKEYWLIEQIAFSGTTPPAHTLVFPTFRQSRYMAYQSIIDGARSLMFFGGNVAGTLTPRDATLGWNWTFWTNVLRPLVQELGDRGLLANALVAPNSALPVTFSGTTSPDIEFCVREVPPYVYMLASKREGASVDVTFSGLPSWAAMGDVLIESPRSVTAHNGQFTDHFDAFDVHVYRFASVVEPPSFVTPPVNQTNTAGTTATFWAAANGTGPLTYQWTRNGTNVTDGTNISGSMTPALTLANISTTDAAEYSIVVSGTGSITSAPASLTVVTNLGPIIYSQPQGLIVTGGSTVNFKVTASGPGTLYYQWQKSGANLSDGGNTTGSTTSSLTLSNVTANDMAAYQVVVSNAVGSQTSYVANLTVVFPMPYLDAFNYQSGSDLGQQTNSNGLTWADVGTSSGGSYVSVLPFNLTVPGLSPSTGNCVWFGGLGTGARFSLPASSPVTSGSIYFSFAFQVASLGSLPSSGVFVAGFNNSIGAQSAQPTVVATRLYMRATNGGYNLGVAKNTSITSQWIWDPRIFSVNQTLFLVGSYTLNTGGAGDDISQLWINPSTNTFGALTPPPASVTASVGLDITGTGVESFLILQRAANEPAGMLLDELRIGTNWASVTPPPPVILNLGAPTRLANGAFQFQFTNSAGPNGSIYASTNLMDWSAIGMATNVSPGVYRFTDPSATSFPRRFYRAQTP